MTKDVETIVASLKGIIDKNGPGYLEDEPYAVYNELIESGAADRKTAATLLHFLAMGLLKGAKFDDAELLSEIIRRELHFAAPSGHRCVCQWPPGVASGQG